MKLRKGDEGMAEGIKKKEEKEITIKDMKLILKEYRKSHLTDMKLLKEYRKSHLTDMQLLKSQGNIETLLDKLDNLTLSRRKKRGNNNMKALKVKVEKISEQKERRNVDKQKEDEANMMEEREVTVNPNSIRPKRVKNIPSHLEPFCLK
jgi:phenylalanyl-tRNA synthetase alpha subunit